MNVEQAKTLATSLMEKHGLTGKGWVFRFDRASRRLGLTSYRRKVISLSSRLTELNSEETVKDTILHEIAHVLAGGYAGHGILWKIQAQAIGAKPEACSKLADIVQVETAWQAVCQDCHIHASRFRKPDLNRSYFHSRCKWKPNRGKITWEFRGQPISENGGQHEL